MTKKVKEYEFRKKTEDIGFEIVTLDYFFKEFASTGLSSPHRINFYIIMFIIEGNGTHLIDFKSYNYKKGSVLFVGNNKVHAWQDSKNVKGWLILFTQKFLSDNQIIFNDISYTYPYNSILYKPIINLLNTETYNTFKSLIEYLFQEYYLPNSEVKQAILQNILRTLLLKIQSYPIKENKDIENETKNLFIRFQKLLDTKISQTRNAKEYCKLLHVTYKKLNATCKTLTNKTVKKFIDDFVILKAKSLLLKQENNIGQVAYSTGFYEVTNFTKFFKKHTNQTPKAFINTIR